MLASRPFNRKPLPERKPMAWPGVQSFAESPRADMGNPITAQPKTVEHRNPALLAMARGKPCLLKVPDVCNGDPLTTVACHSNLGIHGKAKARKADDEYSVWGCSACHAWLDQGKATKQEKKDVFMRAHLEQILVWRRTATDMSYPPTERKAAHWALGFLKSTAIWL